MKYIPRSGTIHLDCRGLDGTAAELRVRLMVRRLRRARKLEVVLGSPGGVGRVMSWARRWMTPSQVEATDQGWTVTLFLLPDEFGSPPRAAVGEAGRRTKRVAA